MGKGLTDAPYQGDVTEVITTSTAIVDTGSYVDVGSPVATLGAYALQVFCTMAKGTGQDITALSFRALMQRTLAGGATDEYPEFMYDLETGYVKDMIHTIDIANCAAFTAAGGLVSFFVYTYGAPYVQFQTLITDQAGANNPTISKFYVQHLKH